ncbi:FG-GAP repeat protein [Streptosporangium sp. NPDC004379]|uniref:FG-GAP repeat protein n=1 Tax=Streptosporangium sp. NPDC004379 TaxID=3366189 RepID=UPI003678EE67
MRAALLTSAVVASLGLSPAASGALPVVSGAAAAPAYPAYPAGTAARSCSGVPSDFDGDGRADLAVAAPYTRVGGRARAGAVTVLPGGRGEKSLLTQDSPGVPGEAETGDAFGSALAAGDFDGDRCADLAVGVSEEDRSRPDADGSGVVQLFHGSPDGLRPGRVIDARDLGGRRGADRFGAALAAGDLDGDGDDELVIGIPGLGGGGVGVYGLTGRAPRIVTQRTGWVGQREAQTDQFGASLATGDFDGDGRDEIAAGTPGDSVRARGQGSVTVLDVRRRTARLLTQDSPRIAGRAEDWDSFGAALAVGDFDADGRDDLAVGVPGEGLTRDQRAMDYGDGTVDVLYGSPGGPGAGRTEAWSQRSLRGEPRYFDRFGAALAAGDLDGDGDDELAVGVPGENAVQVLAGTRSGGLTRAGNALVTGRDGGFGSALAVLPGRGLAVAAPLGGRVALVRVRPGGGKGGRPAAATLAAAAGDALFGYALTGPSTSR